jgi:hypothetical protein
MKSQGKTILMACIYLVYSKLLVTMFGNAGDKSAFPCLSGAGEVYDAKIIQQVHEPCFDMPIKKHILTPGLIKTLRYNPRLVNIKSEKNDIEIR